MKYKMELEKRERAGLWSDGASSDVCRDHLGASGARSLTVNTGQSARHFLTTISSTNTWAAS